MIMSEKQRMTKFVCLLIKFNHRSKVKSFDRMMKIGLSEVLSFEFF